MLKAAYNNNDNTNELNTQISQGNLSSRPNSLSTSKVYQFENLPEPRNATEEEQEAFHSKPYDYDIPNNIEDYNSSKNQDFKGLKLDK
ncbi:unnamed protein product [Rhizophagus irregularis]|nr:unnamed protein product [Rhizophagus irregularis]CAB5351557.1 unnamed protein product [Rhizophagus irregularis]